MGIFMQAAHAICRKPPVALVEIPASWWLASLAFDDVSKTAVFAMVVLESCTECVTRAASARDELVGRRIFGAKSF